MVEGNEAAGCGMKKASEWNDTLASLGATVVANAMHESATEVMGLSAEV